jgi:hypothetical protein
MGNKEKSLNLSVFIIKYLFIFVSTKNSNQLCIIVNNEHYNISESPELEKITVIPENGKIAKVSF